MGLNQNRFIVIVAWIRRKVNCAEIGKRKVEAKSEKDEQKTKKSQQRKTQLEKLNKAELNKGR